MESRDFNDRLTSSLPIDDNSPSRKKYSKPGTYALIHAKTGKVYVGSTQNLYTRVNQHKTRLKAGQHRNSNLQTVFSEDEKIDIRFTVTDSKDAALKLEQHLLDTLRPSGILLNVGEDVKAPQKGRSLSTETKEKLRQATLEQFSTNEAKAHHSATTKALWKDPVYREAHLGRKLSEESMLKSSDSLKRLWKDPDYRQKQIEGRKRRKKPIIFNGVEYESVTDASRILDMPVSTIFSRLKRSTKRNDGENK